MHSYDSQSDHARVDIGGRAQLGGALAVFLGVLLLLVAPAPVPPLDPHKLAFLFIGIGAFLVVAGTVARSILLD